MFLLFNLAAGFIPSENNPACFEVGQTKIANVKVPGWGLYTVMYTCTGATPEIKHKNFLGVLGLHLKGLYYHSLCL